MYNGHRMFKQESNKIEDWVGGKIFWRSEGDYQKRLVIPFYIEIMDNCSYAGLVIGDIQCTKRGIHSGIQNAESVKLELHERTHKEEVYEEEVGEDEFDDLSHKDLLADKAKEGKELNVDEHYPLFCESLINQDNCKIMC